MTCTRVLVIATTYLGYEGITSVIMNYYRNIDREKIQYDFILGCGAMEWVKEEINELGGRVYDIGGRNKRTVRYIHNIIKIIKENKYNIVHIHYILGLQDTKTVIDSIYFEEFFKGITKLYFHILRNIPFEICCRDLGENKHIYLIKRRTIKS